MGQKVNPLGFRLGTLLSWKSRWFASGKDYQKLVLEDVSLRKFLMRKLRPAGVVKIEIERSINKVTFIIHVARPGVVIGRGGTALENLKKTISEKFGQKPNEKKGSPFGRAGRQGMKIDIQIREIKKPDLSAQIALNKLEEMLVKRYPHRRAVAHVLEKIMGAGAKGAKIVLSGRIGGAEISRREKFTAGSIPSQTLRADIDYAQRPALTKSGYVGIKVWIYKGEKEIK